MTPGMDLYGVQYSCGKFFKVAFRHKQAVVFLTYFSINRFDSGIKTTIHNTWASLARCSALLGTATYLQHEARALRRLEHAVREVVEQRVQHAHSRDVDLEAVPRAWQNSQTKRRLYCSDIDGLSHLYQHSTVTPPINLVITSTFKRFKNTELSSFTGRCICFSPYEVREWKRYTVIIFQLTFPSPRSRIIAT